MAQKEGWSGLLKDWGLAFGVTAIALLVWRMLAPTPVTSGDAPALDLPTVDGGRYDLAAEQAEVYVVNFWATWCAPCRQEIPTLSQFALANPDVHMLGVSVDADLSTKALAQASERLGIRYRVLHDPRLVAAGAWGVNSYPTTFVLDRDRHVVEVRAGALDRTTLDALVQKARR